MITIKDINPAEYNPRVIQEKTKKALGFAMSEFGDISGITYNQKTKNLISGHQRFNEIKDISTIKNYKKEKDPTGTVAKADFILRDGRIFPLRIVDWDKKTEKAANIAANNPHLSGKFDVEKLENILGELKIDFDEFEDLNFDELAIDFDIDLDENNDDIKFIDGDFDKSNNSNDIYGGNTLVVRLHKIISYIKNNEVFLQLEKISKKIEERFQDDEKEMQKYKNVIGLKIIELIIENENSIFR
jgi:hypothetical protein